MEKCQDRSIRDEWRRVVARLFGDKVVPDSLVNQWADLLAPLLEEVRAYEREVGFHKGPDLMDHPRVGYVSLAAWATKAVSRWVPIRRTVRTGFYLKFSRAYDDCYDRRSSFKQDFGVEWDSPVASLVRLVAWHFQDAAHKSVTDGDKVTILEAQIRGLRRLLAKAEGNTEERPEEGTSMATEWQEPVVQRPTTPPATSGGMRMHVVEVKDTQREEYFKTLTTTQRYIWRLYERSLAGERPHTDASFPYDVLVDKLRSDGVTDHEPNELAAKQKDLLESAFKRSGMTLGALAKKARVHRETVKRLLSSPEMSVKTTVWTVVRVAAALETPVLGAMAATWRETARGATVH